MVDVIRVEAIQKDVTENMAALLQVSAHQLDPAQSFLSQGADSIVLLEAISRIEKNYGVRISIQQFFEELENIESLSEYLAKHAVARQAVAAPLSEETQSVEVKPPETPKVSAVAASQSPVPSPNNHGSSLSALMHAQIQLVRSTIEQQNTLIGAGVAPIADTTVSTQPVLSREQTAPLPSKTDLPAPVTSLASARDSRLAAQQIEKLHRRSDASMEFGLYFFGDYEAAYQDDKYDLLLESAKYADSHGFSSIWLPERHFSSFGGLSPNPAVLCATLASVTRNIHLRAGSVVAPLHHPVRLAEDWALVDNLSQGRTGLAMASGWHQDDFVFAPEKYENRQAEMQQSLATVRRLWRGDRVECTTTGGAVRTPKLFPQPCQSEPPIWLTVVNNIEVFRQAGRDGHAVLTNLMAQSPAVLAENIAAYRQAWRDAGHVGEGYVSLLMHTYLTANANDAIEAARKPFIQYLESAVGLFKSLVNGLDKKVDFDAITDSDRDYLLNAAYDDYVEHRALIGSVDSTRALVQSIADIGVQEIGCFIDFGVAADQVADGLPHLNQLKNSFGFSGKQRKHL